MANTTTAQQIPAPAGALSVDEWRTEGSSGEQFRPFKGTSRQLEHCGGLVDLNISGEQYADGRIERFVFVGDLCLDPPHLVQFARAFLAAHDEIQRLSGSGD